jgi:hypothetical protein
MGDEDPVHADEAGPEASQRPRMDSRTSNICW